MRVILEVCALRNGMWVRSKETGVHAGHSERSGR